MSKTMIYNDFRLVGFFCVHLRGVLIEFFDRD